MHPSSDTGSPATLFTRTLEVVGAGAALVGWVAVVGAAREWAKFRAAGIPSPAPTAALLPRTSLIGDGLTALVPVLGIGLVLAGLTYLAIHRGLRVIGYRRRKSFRRRAYFLRRYASRPLLISLVVPALLSWWFHV